MALLEDFIGATIINYRVVRQSSSVTWYHNHQLPRGTTIINCRLVPQSSVVTWYHNQIIAFSVKAPKDEFWTL